MSADAPITDQLPERDGVIQAAADWVADVGSLIIDKTADLGSMASFAGRTFKWMFTRLPRRETLVPAFYQIGVLSLFVILLTGGFIGVILAVQAYGQFRFMHLETRMGAVINLSIVRELGPVLAATMLAGRVGGAMAAELGTMRVTEQIDALASMGVDPVHYLVVPRFLGCLLLIPALTVFADLMGILGGAGYSCYFLNIDLHHYVAHAQQYVKVFDVLTGVFKSMCFGAAISLISCYHGFHCDAGAEGVGRATTTAFVYSFVVILMLDVMLAIGSDSLYFIIWPEGPKLV